MTADVLETIHNRNAEKRRRCAELMALWEAEDAAIVIDLREPATVEVTA